MSAAVVTLVVLALLVAAAVGSAVFLRRFWRHTGQRVDRLADPAPTPEELADAERRREVLRQYPPPRPVWPPQMTDQPPE